MMSLARRGTVPMDSIAEEFYVRARLNDDHMLQLAGLYSAGTKLPPLLVTRLENKLVDGRHRLAALKHLGKKAVEVEWTDETDEQKLLAMALRANIGGALPPTNADIVYAMQQMIDAGMQQAVIIKEFSASWPPAVIRRYYSDAQSNLTKDRIIKAKRAIVEQGMTVNDAAVTFKVKLDTLKTAITGKKRRRNSTAEIKGTLTGIFRSRGGSMGQLMRRIQTQMEDGDLSWNQVEDILEHLEACALSTTRSVNDWRKRLEAKAGKGKKAAA